MENTYAHKTLLSPTAMEDVKTIASAITMLQTAIQMAIDKNVSKIVWNTKMSNVDGVNTEIVVSATVIFE